MSKVLSAPNRRHFSGEEYRAPPHDRRVRRRVRDYLPGRGRPAGQDAAGDRSGRQLSAGLRRRRAPRAVHDPGKIIADLAGPWRWAAARERAWALAGDAAPAAGGELVTVDLDATIVTACDKEQAAPTWKKTFGLFHPLTVFADHGPEGSGEPLAILLRAGSAGSNTAADHIQTARLALAQLPPQLRRKVLIRADSGGGTHDFVSWLAHPGRRLAYSVGFTITQQLQDAVLKVPAAAWTPAWSGPGHGSRRSPACWTWPPGRPGCGCRRTGGLRRPPPAATPGRTLALGHPDHHCATRLHALAPD